MKLNRLTGALGMLCARFRDIGSAIVNDGNGRYFEPAPGRTVMVGVRVRFDERAVTE